jgi:hypothetical protein
MIELIASSILLCRSSTVSNFSPFSFRFQITEQQEVTETDIKAVRTLRSITELAAFKMHDRSWRICSSPVVQDLPERIQSLLAEIAAVELPLGCSQLTKMAADNQKGCEHRFCGMEGVPHSSLDFIC